jgi:hypothetical protein
MIFFISVHFLRVILKENGEKMSVKILKKKSLKNKKITKIFKTLCVLNNLTSRHATCLQAARLLSLILYLSLSIYLPILILYFVSYLSRHFPACTLFVAT